MKFKTIFIIFNVIIIFSFSIIFLMPLILFGQLQFTAFFTTNWIALAIFLTVLVVFNWYFIKNFKLFSLLEEENWFDLITYLENLLYKKHDFGKNRIKMLMNAYLVTSNTEAMLRLENYLSRQKPSRIEYYSLQFGVPYLLNNDPAAAEVYFGRLLASEKARSKSWLRWNYGLSLVQQNKYDAGKNEFLKILLDVKDPILHLLTLYILKSFSAGSQRLKEQIDAGVQQLRSSYNILSWRKMVEQQKHNVQVLVLSRIIDQAGNWLFEENILNDTEPDESQMKIIH